MTAHPLQALDAALAALPPPDVRTVEDLMSADAAVETFLVAYPQTAATGQPCRADLVDLCCAARVALTTRAVDLALAAERAAASPDPDLDHDPDA